MADLAKSAAGLGVLFRGLKRETDCLGLLLAKITRTTSLVASVRLADLVQSLLVDDGQNAGNALARHLDLAQLGGVSSADLFNAVREKGL